MSTLEERIEALDVSLFSPIEAQTNDWDRRALLSLHSSAATVLGSFRYLEVGSYKGGSLQVVIQDPRCTRVMSIDPRPTEPPDKRGGSWSYEQNDLRTMLSLLRALPAADLDKLTTFETGTEALRASELPEKADLCFVDGEHTDEAAFRDARFCAEALEGAGIIAFHDCQLLRDGIGAFLGEAWTEISAAVMFAVGPVTGVFALELGGRQMLRQPVVRRAVGSRWHSTVWGAVSRVERSARPALLALSAIPAIDRTIGRARGRIGGRGQPDGPRVS
jgi:hypothetical protein